MTHIKNKSRYICTYYVNYYHQNHLCLKCNIYCSSTPGFKAMKLQDHLHYTDFKMKHCSKNNVIFLQKTW